MLTYHFENNAGEEVWGTCAKEEAFDFEGKFSL